jgi:hypothetical protein
MSCFAMLWAVLLAMNPLSAADDSTDTERSAALSSSYPSEFQLLEKARAANSDLYSNLKSFICKEEIERFKGDLRGSKTRTIDRVSAKLSFENGVEHYTEVRQNNRTQPSLSALAGAWSEGEFGTLLQQTQKLLESQKVTFVSFTAVTGVPAAIYKFDVVENESPWDLEVSGHHYRIPFSTEVWIAVDSGHIIKIARKSTAIPAETHISEIDWDVTLDRVDLNGQPWLLPTTAAYAVYYGQSKRREWNQMSFSDYRRYSSESQIRFDGFR